MVSQRQISSTANMDLWVPNYKLSITMRELKDTGAYFYNMLPPQIRSLSAFLVFKFIPCKFTKIANGIQFINEMHYNVMYCKYSLYFIDF